MRHTRQEGSRHQPVPAAPRFPGVVALSGLGVSLLGLASHADTAASEALAPSNTGYMFLALLLSLTLLAVAGWAFRLLGQLRSVSEALNTANARLSHDTNAVEASLRSAEPQQRMLFEQLPVGLALCRLNGDLIDVNPAFAHILGRSVEETLQLTYWDITPKSYEQAELELLATINQAGRFGPYEKEYIHKDGHLVPVRLSGILIKRNGESLVWSCVEDITDIRSTEASLRDREAQYHTIFDAAPVGLIISNRSGETVAANRAAAQMHGYTPEEFITLRPEQFIHPNSMNAFQQYMGAVFSEQSIRLEAQDLRRDGTPIDIDVFGVPMRYGGEVHGLGILQDITELKQAEHRRRLSDERYRSLVETSQEWIWEIDVQGNHTFSNPAITHILGVACDAFLAEEAFARVHPDNRDSVRAEFDRHIAEKSGWRYWTIRWRHADGTYRHLESNAEPILDASGKLTGFRGADRDITERLNAERLLRESLQASADTISAIPSGMIIYRYEAPSALYMIEANPAASRLMNISLSEKIGEEFGSVWADYDQPGLKDAIVEVVHTGTPLRQDYLKRDDTGQIVLAMHFHAFPMPNSQVGVAFEDILEHKQTEQKLERYRFQLEEIVRERTEALEEAQSELIKKERLAALGQLIGMVSHELRNPLGTIRGSLFSIGKRVASEDYDRLPAIIERAERNIIRCDRIIEELLDFSRDRTIDVAEVDLDPWLREVFAEIDELDGITCQWALEANITIPLDTEQFRRVLINIITNAVHAMNEPEAPGKTLTVSTRVIDADVEIVVEDRGVGIPPEIMARIGEPLFSTKGFGVGLGVPIIEEIVAAHGGSVTYDSRVGRGTRVRIRLPHASSPPGSAVAET